MRAAALAAALLGLGAAAATAQVPRREVIRTDTLRRAGDTLRTRADSARPDTTRGRSPVPRAPSRQFPPPDSLIQALLERPGFRVTRYAADSVRLLAEEKEIRLAGSGLIARDGSTLEADTVRYVERTCGLYASGTPRLFDPSGNLMGEGMRYDACNKTGVVEHATTDLQHGGGTWLLRGDIAVDNTEDRTYAAGAEITSCTLDEAHYHFATREVKWVNKRLMVARPAVLYVADVPILWLPFVFQDTRRGRRSGILAPQFGINDIVRFNPGYARHITNIGYYFAISDYADAQTSVDWYAGRSLTLNGRLRYRWLDRFLAGGIAYQELRESGGGSSRRISWSHQQQFSLASQLTANLDYATSSRVISRNAVDPILAVGTIDSRLNFQRRSSWGTLNLGGSRTQSLDKPQVTLAFPTLAFTPNPVALSRRVTVSPSLTFTNSLLQNGGPSVAVFRNGAVADSLFTDSRRSNFSMSAPLRIGSWTLSNSFSVADEWSSQRSTTTIYPDPADSTRRVVRTSAETFQTGVDWSIGFGLPVLFQGTWNLQPATQLVNTGGGPYALRNQYTAGRYLTQGKRFQFSAGVSPTLFGLFPGFGPVQRIRHAVSPVLSWAYSPAAMVDSAFAVAQAGGRPVASLRVPARHTLSLGLSQNFEAKLRPPALPGDSAAADSAAAGPADGSAPAEGRKLKLLSIQSDAIGYDFEQAKLPGHTGWTSQTWGNTVSSDLVRGFSLRFAHDLWDGPVGLTSSRFRPFLTSVQTGFSVGAGTFGLVRRLLGLGSGGPPAPDSLPGDSLAPRNPTDVGRGYSNAFQRGPLATQYSTVDRLGGLRGGGFQATLNFALQRSRPPSDTAAAAAAPRTQSQLNGTVHFSPTRHWTVSWQTSYNFTQGTFADHVVRLDRDLHDWRATFTFVRSPNGNFLFNFYIELIAEPDLKFAYDQRNVR